MVASDISGDRAGETSIPHPVATMTPGASTLERRAVGSVWWPLKAPRDTGGRLLRAYTGISNVCTITPELQTSCLQAFPRVLKSLDGYQYSVAATRFSSELLRPGRILSFRILQEWLLILQSGGYINII